DRSFSAEPRAMRRPCSVVWRRCRGLPHFRGTGVDVMNKRAGHARYGGPGVFAAIARRRVPVAATAVALVAGSVLAVTASASGPADSGADAGAAAAAPAPRIKVQEWLYPGAAGSPTCTAPAEYGDGRLKDGVLKPEYYTIDGTGSAVLMSASDPDY